MLKKLYVLALCHYKKLFLIPKQVESHGLRKDSVSFSDTSISEIINKYTREAGVRNLEREVTTVCRRVAKKIAVGNDKSEQYLLCIRYKSNEISINDDPQAKNDWAPLANQKAQALPGLFVLMLSGACRLSGNLSVIGFGRG